MRPSNLAIRNDMTDCFHCSPLLIPALDKYYVLYWETPYFFSQLKDGCITHDGVRYQVCYHPKFGPAVLRKHAHIKISFRKLGSQAYAVIRRVYTEDNKSQETTA